MSSAFLAARRRRHRLCQDLKEANIPCLPLERVLGYMHYKRTFSRSGRWRRVSPDDWVDVLPFPLMVRTMNAHNIGHISAYQFADCDQGVLMIRRRFFQKACIGVWGVNDPELLDEA